MGQQLASTREARIQLGWVLKRVGFRAAFFIHTADLCCFFYFIFLKNLNMHRKTCTRGGARWSCWAGTGIKLDYHG